VPNPETPSLITAENQTMAGFQTSGQNKIGIEDQSGGERILMQTPKANTWIRMGAPNDPPGLSLDADTDTAFIGAADGLTMNTSNDVNITSGNDMTLEATNDIKMQSDAGDITIKAATGDIKMISQNNHGAWFVGHSESYKLSNDFSFTGGASESIFIGADVGIKLALGLSLTAGADVGVRIGPTFTKSFCQKYSKHFGNSTSTNTGNMRFEAGKGNCSITIHALGSQGILLETPQSDVEISDRGVYVTNRNAPYIKLISNNIVLDGSVEVTGDLEVKGKTTMDGRVTAQKDIFCNTQVWGKQKVVSPLFTQVPSPPPLPPLPRPPEVLRPPRITVIQPGISERVSQLESRSSSPPQASPPPIE
ncbi:MAG: hypothetical protein J7M24_03370, partial [Candidatus Latescibacteria bacterium]|nr:hypothetical protein [Candidatus Latescibacterota bacterium]